MFLFLGLCSRDLNLGEGILPSGTGFLSSFRLVFAGAITPKDKLNPPEIPYCRFLRQKIVLCPANNLSSVSYASESHLKLSSTSSVLGLNKLSNKADTCTMLGSITFRNWKTQSTRRMSDGLPWLFKYIVMEAIMRKQLISRIRPVGLNSVVWFCLASCLSAQSWTGIISPSRAINWSNAGVAGGIPTNRTQCGSTIAAGASTATIQAAINACGANQYVQLGAGTFSGFTGVTLNSNMSIRGMGANSTFIVATGTNSCSGIYGAFCIQSGDLNYYGNISNGPVAWTAGYAQGTTVITLASVPNLKIGNPIILDQLDDTTDKGGVLVCSQTTGSPVCSLDGNNGNSARSGRGQEQIVMVTGCNGSTTVGTACSGTNVAVTISPGLYMPNWNACNASGGCAPQAWWATSPITGVGVENLSIDCTACGAPSSSVVMFNATNSWVSGIRSIDTDKAHVFLWQTEHVTIQNSYFFLTQNSIDQSYGWAGYTASDTLFQNNICQAVSGCVVTGGADPGTVIAYNFGINDYYTASAGWNNAMSNMHTDGADMMLYEGNIGVSLYADVFHGTHNFDTFFRNYLPGQQPACWASGSSYATAVYGPCTNPLVALEFDAYSRFFNVVGNVLGETGVQTSYISGSLPIYALGNGDSIPGVTVASDPNVATTIMLWGNYDTVNAASRFVASEVPSALTAAAQAPYSNPVPANNNLPPSFYYSSQPSWWPASKPWPAIGPDVTGGNISGVSGHAYTLPAEDCYLNTMSGASNGTGGPYSFNASTCYGGSSVTQAPAPTVAPPTALTAVAQ